MRVNRRLHLCVRGRVQGVFYRASTRAQGRQLGLTGWVRNLPDGSVEVVAEGAEEALQDLEAWCHDGPPGARVEAVDATWGEATEEFDGFRVAR